MSIPPMGKMRQRWGAPRCGYYSNAAMLWIGGRILPLGYLFVWFAAAYFFVAAPKARRASMEYLDRLRPHRSRLRRWCDTYRHLVEFGFLLLDRALMLTTSHHGFSISCDGLANLTKPACEGHGVLMLTSHFGNAEIAAPYMHKMGLDLPIHIVMYQDARDKTEQFHIRHRHQLSRINVISTIDPLSAGIKIIAALKKGDLVAIRADRTMEGKTLSATLLGARIELPAGPFLAAALSNAPVVHVYTCRLGYRRYVCIIAPPCRYGDDQPGTREERMAAAAQAFATQLECVICRYPLQWSNFYDYFSAGNAAAS